MVTVLIGDLLKSKAQTLVNTVNCVGVMGKGIALEFKRAFPDMYEEYAQRCRRHEVNLGLPYPYYLSDGRIVLNFPTKEHWRSPSKLDDIVLGMNHLIENYKDWGITSIAVPPLGCGNGQLEWKVVGPTLFSMLSNLAVDVEFYAPAGTPPEQLDLNFLGRDELTAEQATRPAAKMDPAWVALVETLDRIEHMSIHQPVGRITFQKLAYFATEFGIPTGLVFRRGSYGPHDPNIKQIIGKLMNNGLINERPYGRMLRVTVGPTFKDAQRNYERDLAKWSETIVFLSDFLARMNTLKVEAAATIHFVSKELRQRHGVAPSESEVVTEVLSWKGPRLDEVNLNVFTRVLGTLRVIETKGDAALSLPNEELMLA
jgi:O-acetyl-ADP-ribose deacetylase (regulator of RNase III)/uncharacterized protein YwgA